MAKHILIAAKSTGSGGTTGNATRYNHISGAFDPSGTEANAQTLIRGTYTQADLFVRVNLNVLNSSSTIKSRVNGADGDLVVSIGASTTGTFEDTTNSDSLVDGDLTCVQIIYGGTSAQLIRITPISVTHASVADIFILQTTNAAGIGGSSSNQTRWVGIAGSLHGLNTLAEGKTDFKVRAAATWTNLRTYVINNSLNGSTTITTRINGANGNQSLSIPATTTGSFEDTSNSDSVAIGDLVNYQTVTGGTLNNIGFGVIQVKSSSTNRQYFIEDIGRGPADDFSCIEDESHLTVPGATELETQVKARFIFSLKNLYVDVFNNTINASSTIALRVNGSNSSLSVSIPNSTSGVFEDITDTITTAATDLLSIGKLSPGASSGSMGVYIGMEAVGAVVVGAQGRSFGTILG